jgi:biuret amidohydrolase
VVVCVTTTPPGVAPGRTPGPFRTDLQLEAAGVDGFFGSRLDHLLRSLRRDRLLVVGGWLESNVHSTLRSANDRGYECLLVLDACTPYDAALVAASRSQVEMSGGIFGAVGETAHVLAALAALRPSERNLA